MGRKNQKRRRQKNIKNNQKNKQTAGLNFVSNAGRGCYIVRRDIATPDWMLEWEEIDPGEFSGEEEEVPDIAIDTDEFSLSLCNVDSVTKVAYITVYDTKCRGCHGQSLQQGSTTDSKGITNSCITFIVLCPPTTFAHLCYLELPPNQDITELRIESDVQEWNRHPNPSDEHTKVIGFPLQPKAGAGMRSSFLCTQGEGGALTHVSTSLKFVSNCGFVAKLANPKQIFAILRSSFLEICTLSTFRAISGLHCWRSAMAQLFNQKIRTL